MIASLLRLVLVLTLAFNGISAPMAMAHGGHAAQATAEAAPDPGPHAGHAAGHGSPAQEGHHEGHGAASDESSAGDPIAKLGCCDGPECRCGCILPPAIPLSTALAVQHVLPRLAPSHDVDGSLSLALAAPFRPPSR